ncbi:MAG: glutamine synthetase [Alphaproteobacteria bacterium]|nr:glutamine synthetase [Alphaproteobacteria bacterium]
MMTVVQKKTELPKRGRPQQPRSQTAFQTVEAFVIDVNGVPRGKWVPADGLKKIVSSGLRLPYSAFAPDIWGNDVPATGLIRETGDNDCTCRLVPGRLKPAPWLKNTAQALLTVEGFAGDPRHVLARVLGRYKKAGLTPVIAAELEFYLIDGERDPFGAPQPARIPATGRHAGSARTYSLGAADAFRKTLADIGRFCAAQDLPVDTTVSENGPGQFEINLLHAPDALGAADDAIFLKRLIKGAAARNGHAATFMAKPYSDYSGSGMHVHFSIIDRQGRNIFAGKDDKGSPALKYALGGLCTTMADSMAVFAPNANAYRRFASGTAAPTKIAWGYDNRSTALRVPHGELDATRIEHRVSGADVNPYLVFAVMLAGALEGLEGKIIPPPPVTGSAYTAKAPALPATWDAALDIFSASAFIDRALGRETKKIFLACKRQEQEILAAEVTSAEHAAYLTEI